MSTGEQRIPENTVLFRAGDPCRGFVVLREGSIRVTLGASNGKEVVLYRVRPGDVCLQTFSCLVENRDYTAEGVAESELVAEIVPPNDFLQRIAIDSDFRNSVFQAVARRFSDFEELVENIALTGLKCRLARTLLRLAGEGSEIDTTHDQLAKETASGRAAITRQLTSLSEDSLVRLERGRILITDRDGLESLTNFSA
jgi:CRP/FNR family transcriptional regulator